MDQRLPVDRSRFSAARASSSLGYATHEADGGQRSSSAASSSRPQRASVAFSALSGRSGLEAPSERDEQENVFATPPGSPVPSINNVFATPTNSTPNTPNGSQTDLSAASTPTPSHYRHSLSLSIPRSLSPIGVSDGSYFPGSGGLGGADYVPGQFGGVYGHSRSVSLARSLTPSITSTINGNGLNRSNTVNTHTTNTSTLYSVPSHLSQITSPPSPLGSIAPVRPRFDYGGHQQTLSVHGSEVTDLDNVENPFGDAFIVPVADGYAPHVERGLPSRGSDSGGSAPPPYSQYPEAAASPKPEGQAFVEPMRRFSSNPDSGISVGSSDEQQRRSVAAGAVLPVGGVVPAGPEAPEADTSGARKEWKKKEWKGMRVWILIGGIILALLVGLAVGLGVGLGIGMHHQDKIPPPTPAVTTSTFLYPPAPDVTAPPRATVMTFPSIPTGAQVLQPISLSDSNAECDISAQSTSTPFPFLSNNLWSCNIPDDDPLTWIIDSWPKGVSWLSDLNSVPDAVTESEWLGANWGGYIVSSQEGITVHDKPTVVVDQNGNTLYYSASGGDWRVGEQGMQLFNEPLGFMSSSNYDRKRDNGDDIYSFGVLYNKTVLLREATLVGLLNNPSKSPATNNSNGTTLADGEVAWLCTWEKTLLEVEIYPNETADTSQDTNKGLGSESTNQQSASADIASPLSTLTVTHTVSDISQSTSLNMPIPPWDSNNPPFDSAGGPSLVATYGPPPQMPGYGGPVHPSPPLVGVVPPPTPPPVPVNVLHPAHYSNVPVDKGVSQNSEGSPVTSEAPSSTSSTTSEGFEFVHKHSSLAYDPNNIARRHHQLHNEKRSTRFSKKIKIKEYRPTEDRIRDILGISHSDPDHAGRATPGQVMCTRVVKLKDDKGLRAAPLVEGRNATVVLTESESTSSSRARLKKRDSPDTGCTCEWKT